MRARVFDKLQMATRMQRGVMEADALAFAACCDGDQVRDYLVRWYGFESPLESACVMMPGLASYTATTRPRSRYIARDLADLGVPPEKLLEAEPCPLGPFRDLAQALGWLYVAERTVVTNRLCHQRLAKRAPELAACTSCLNCYGATTDARWHRFGVTFERTARHADPERIAAVAIESYDALIHWLRPVTLAQPERRSLRSSAS